ncbi:MAG TPA: hypothetical protein IGS17_16600 [Oscillatoriales cyanobacterium M59_W2019_021]|nr:MAG: hypothetical protein D6728_04725 [Cyanobacteria bacterium J055]HIK30697.1 hypothetical protein [Oscillatoriales cyanobacterium M4454_W2019_049]HIK52525.1 hypothetical protein [Oscillatoriales cyanobacterium M59_W2019_021]
MKPKFKDMTAWHQAELLMQPTLIRTIDNLRKHLEKSTWKGTYREIQEPFPGYKLDLELGDRQETIDIWELCYQICFRNYQPTHAPDESYEVEIDTSLFNENGEVDWIRLDAKAQSLIADIFNNLGGG